jgi:hypothetical protein
LKAASSPALNLFPVQQDLRLGASRNVKISPFVSVFARFFSGSPSKVRRRRSVPIMAYVGSNGSGKTAMMVRDTLPSLDAGRLVYSTVPLYKDGELHPCYRPFTWHDLLTQTNCDFLLDEVIGIASSRESSSMSPEVQARLNQLRKRDIVLRWTAPAWPRADKIIREVTQAVTECRGYLPAKADSGQLWAPKTLFRLATFDTKEFDDWTSGKRDKNPSELKEWFYAVGSRAFETYKTLDSVESVKPHDTTKCVECGNKVKVAYCNCKN